MVIVFAWKYCKIWFKCWWFIFYSWFTGSASFHRNDKGETVTASYFHTVSPLTNTAVGAELTHSFTTNENTLTIGTQHALDPLTSVKARVNNYGKASALVQHEWRPKSLITISGEVDTRAIEKSAKIGLAVALKPWSLKLQTGMVPMQIFQEIKLAIRKIGFGQCPIFSVKFWARNVAEFSCMGYGLLGCKNNSYWSENLAWDLYSGFSSIASLICRIRWLKILLIHAFCWIKMLMCRCLNVRLR